MRRRPQRAAPPTRAAALPAVVALLMLTLPSLLLPPTHVHASPSSSASAHSYPFVPYGYQSGRRRSSTNTAATNELLDDDAYASSMYHDASRNLVYFTGVTYGTYFDGDGADDDDPSHAQERPHLDNGDCFLGVLKLPPPQTTLGGNGGGGNDGKLRNSNKNIGEGKAPELIYSRRFGTRHNSESCSSIVMLPGVKDDDGAGLLRDEATQLKLAILGHVLPVPLSSREVNALGPPADNGYDDEYRDGGGGGRRGGRRRLVQLSDANDEADHSDNNNNHRYQSKEEAATVTREMQHAPNTNGDEGILNRGGFLHSLSSSGPITEKGRAYGFAVDVDLSLSYNDEGINSAGGQVGAYGALLGGAVLDSSNIVYPVSVTQNSRDPSQVYAVSVHSDGDENAGVVLNPEYDATSIQELDGTLHRRPDTTMGGAGGGAANIVGGAPKYGTDFYVRVQQLTVTPYGKLSNVEPTYDEKVKRTMNTGWGFGFKLNDADDVRPSTVVFVKGRTPDDDLLLLGGTTRRRRDGGGGGGRGEELDGFVTKLIPPPPSPVMDVTTGATVEDAMMEENETNVHQTKRIDSTTGRDETVTSICLPPPDPTMSGDTLVRHAYVVGSTTSSSSSSGSGGGDDPSLAYILKMRLDDLSTVWKAHLPSVHPAGIGGHVLGEGCAVSPDGRMVYLAGTIDGGSALNTGNSAADEGLVPIGGATDVFAVAFDVEFGNVQWAKQFGTLREDKLARGGGVACDNEGNLIVMGSTRGAMQRYRPGLGQTRMASDVFIMSLSRFDGSYANAPFTGHDGANDTSAAASGDIDRGRMSPRAIAGVSLVVIGFVGAVLLLIRRRNSRQLRRYAASERMWDHYGGDNLNGSDRQLGGRRRRSSSHVQDGESYSPRNTSWLTGEGDDCSVNSHGSGSSRGSYRSKTEENVEFIASLRKEANSTMKKMVNGGPMSRSAPVAKSEDTGASIKTLLNQYRDAKKGAAIARKGGTVGDASTEVTSDSQETKWNKKYPPPPPPPRRKNDNLSGRDVSEMSADGLSDFSII